MTALSRQETGAEAEAEGSAGSWSQGKGQGLPPTPMPAEGWREGRARGLRVRGTGESWGGEGPLASWDHRVGHLEGAL